jgi:hypothetical protein
MNLMSEYISRRQKGLDLESELQRLVSEYNKLRSSYLFVYAAALRKPIPGVALDQEDYYAIHDMLSGRADIRKLDVYLETPGGSGETAEEIVRFLRSKFESVSFVVSGEAKSAGTIMVMSGDEILMTETGSLGPIDAQIRIGRSVVSAHDYMEWINGKRVEAEQHGRMNPFDATMVAQISPGELLGVKNSLEFAQEMVERWLADYKFRTWTVTETRKLPVSPAMKQSRAKEIAALLCNHSRWKSHGKSIKAVDLDAMGLRIVQVESDPRLADIVYRIQTVCRFLFESSSTFKVFVTQDGKLFKSATVAGIHPQQPPGVAPDVVEIEVKCTKCGITHRLYAKFVPNKQIDTDLKARGFMPFPGSAKMKCKCGAEIDLSGIKNDVELQTGRKMVF